MTFNLSEFEFTYDCGYPVYRQIWIKNNLPNLDAYLLRQDILATNPENGEKFIVLYVDPNNYSPVSEGGSNFTAAGKSSVLTVQLRRKGFNAKFQYPEANIGQVIKLIASKCLQDKQLLTVIDFVYPEPEDYFTGYTVREGLFIDVEISTGMLQQNFPVQAYVVPSQQYFPDGFSATFSERNHRWM